jgi:hypothetical protein
MRGEGVYFFCVCVSGNTVMMTMTMDRSARHARWFGNPLVAVGLCLFEQDKWCQSYVGIMMDRISW